MPFFLFVGYVDTHSPHTDAQADLVDPYHDATFTDIPRDKFADCHGVVRVAGHKLIVRKPFRDVGFGNELYDLHTDPRETVNRITDPAYTAVVKDLTTQLEAFFDRHTIAGRSG